MEKSFCKASFLQRISSHSFASTSQPSRNLPHSYSFAYDGFANDTQQSVRPPLDPPVREEDLAQLDRWADIENWDGKKQREITAAETSPGHPRGPKSLKINQDLLLYHARQKRQQAFRLKTYSKQLEALQDAEQALNKCISLDATDARAYVTLGKIMQQQRRYKEARKVYEDAIAVTGGKNAHVWQAWATLEGRTGNLAAARKYFNAAVLVDPKHAASWHAWGMLEKRNGNMAAAKDLWIKGVKKCQGPPNPHLYQSLGVLAGEMGFVDEARAWFRRGTESIRGSKSHALWHAWAILEERQGEPRVVRYLYGKGLEVSPSSRYIHLAWAMFERANAQPDNAKQLLQRGAKLNPKDAALLQAWAVLENEEGNTDRARELFKTASELDPKMTHVWQAWGMLEMKAGRYSQARHLFQSGIWSSEESSQTCQVWQAWATLEFRAGNIALARTMYNCAVKAEPSSKKAWESWLVMERSLNETRRALMLETAMKRGCNPASLPDSFATPENVTMGEELSMIESVVNTVNEWMNKLDRTRRVVRRAPPSYLASLPSIEFSEGDVTRVPEVEAMMAFHEKAIELPKLSRSS